jgi:hypothetical protein
LIKEKSHNQVSRCCITEEITWSGDNGWRPVWFIFDFLCAPFAKPGEDLLHLTCKLVSSGLTSLAAALIAIMHALDSGRVVTNSEAIHLSV